MIMYMEFFHTHHDCHLPSLFRLLLLLPHGILIRCITVGITLGGWVWIIWCPTFVKQTPSFPYCSVIQGSCISGWMFNTYCNKIPLLPKFITTEIYHKLVDRNKLDTKNISHSVHNFIDDGSIVIGFINQNSIKNYIEKYYILLSKYHNID